MSENNGMTTKELVLLLHEKVDEVLVAHDGRLTALEEFRNRILGGAKVVGLLTIFVGPLLGLLLR